MKRILIAMALFLLTAIPVSAAEMHLVVLSQEDAEIEVSVDRSDWKTENLERGINYRTYQTVKATPTAEIMSYGDIIPLKTVQGSSGDWYCMARIAPPRDGDGEVSK